MSALIAHLRDFWYRLSTRRRRETLDRDLAEEMLFHEELLARDIERSGVSAGDAQTAARRQFGNALSLRERSADAWGFPSLEDVWQDVRYGARLLRQSPMFAAVAIGAIGLAIGVNAGFFTLIDTFFWQPVPVARPERLVKISLLFPQGEGSILFSYPDVQTIAAHAKTIEAVIPRGTCSPVAFRASAASTATAASVGCVAGDYFAVLGGSAAVGRTLMPADDRTDAPPAIVISDMMWTRAFGRAPDIVGRTVTLNGTRVVIAGVVRSDFVGLNFVIPDLWLTFTLAERVGVTPGRLLSPTNRFIYAKARLRPAVSRQQAEAELSGLFAEPPVPPGSREERTRIVGVRVVPNESAIPFDATSAQMVAPAMLVVALVLAIACANLANLLLSRALVRQQEIAVRLALGASRWRLLRQLLTESLLIAVLGAVLGLFLAHETVFVVSRAFLANVPNLVGTVALKIQESWHVVAYTVALAVISVLIFGLAPALQATSGSLTSALKGEDALFGTRLRRSRFRDGLVAVQVAGCVVLLGASGILMQSLRTVAQAETGLETGQVSLANVGFVAAGHVPPSLIETRAVFAGRVTALPGVERTARAMHPPYASWWPPLQVAPASNRERLSRIPYNRVTPRYFDVVGQRVIAGRGFTADDSAADADVAIVTADAAKHFWPTAAAVGQLLRVATAPDEPEHVYRVVGVAANAHSQMMWDFDGNGYIFLPASSGDFATFDMPLLVRAAPHAPELARRIQDVARQVDANAPLSTATLTSEYDRQMTPLKYGALITAGVGAIGLGLAVIGLYGIVAFAVTQRRRELAVHVAMGAGPADVMRLVLRREMRLVLAGLVAGLVLAAGETQLIASLSVPLSPLGVSGFVVLSAILVAVSLIATVLPASKALKIAPMQVLRQE